MNKRSSRSELGQRGAPGIVKKTVLKEKSSINQVTKHVDKTALSSNSPLYHKSPLHCRIESLCFHVSLVHIECPIGSRTAPAIWLIICWRCAVRRVKAIAKNKIANDTILSVHITPPYNISRRAVHCNGSPEHSSATHSTGNAFTLKETPGQLRTR